MGVMPWEGCLTMPPLSCAVLGLGGWMEQDVYKRQGLYGAA